MLRLDPLFARSPLPAEPKGARSSGPIGVRGSVSPTGFDDDCFEAFETLKKALNFVPIVQPPDWNLPFEIMCDASDYAIGVVLGQRVDKKINVIHYASKTLDSAQKNYATIEKEFLAVVFA